MSLLSTLEGFFDEYIFEPLFDEGIAELYEDSILEDIIEYPLYEKMDPTGGLGAGSPVTIGSVAKDFAGGFLNIGSGKGGSGIYKTGPTKMPAAPKVSAPRSRVTSGLGAFTPTEVNLANNFGATNAVKANLYKASISDVPQIKDLVAALTRSANRRSGVRNRLGSSTMSGVKTRTSHPYSRKPKYYG